MGDDARAVASERRPAWLIVREAAELLGRHRTRVYDLVRAGDLVADHGDTCTLRIDRSSVDGGS